MQKKQSISFTPRALHLLQALKRTNTGAAIYEHVENILEDFESSSQQTQQAYLALTHVLLNEFSKQLSADSPLLIHIKLIKMRLCNPLSAAEIRAISKQIQTISHKLSEEILLPEPDLEEPLHPATEDVVTTPPTHIESERPSEMVHQAEPQDEDITADQNEEHAGLEEEALAATPETTTLPELEGLESDGSDTSYDKNFEDKRNRILKIQQSLTHHVNEVIKQNEKFGVLLEVEHETLRHTDNIEEVGQLKESLIREVSRLTDGHKALAAKLNSASKYLQIFESEGQHLNEELARVHILSLTDELTELPNRRAFMRRLEDEVGRVQRFGYPLSLVLLDLDHFKAINDVHGHAAGDAVLRNFSSNILSIFRHHDLAARYGGEEFAVILPNTDNTGAQRALQKVQMRARSTPYHYDGKASPMPTFSAGIALYHPGEPPSSLIERADTALYQAKHLGRNRIVLGDEETGEEVDATSSVPSAQS